MSTIVVNARALKKALLTVKPCVPNRPILSVLGYVRIEVRNSQELCITGNNLDMQVSIAISGDVEATPGTVLVLPYKDLVHALTGQYKKNDTVTLSCDNCIMTTAMVVSVGDSSLECYPSNEHPRDLLGGDARNTFCSTTDVATFHNLFSAALYFTDKSDKYPFSSPLYTQCVRLQSTQGRSEMTISGATMHQVGIETLPMCPIMSESDLLVYVDHNTGEKLLRCLPESGTMTVRGYSRDPNWNLLTLCCGATEITVSSLSGVPYPDVQRVVNDFTMTLASAVVSMQVLKDKLFGFVIDNDNDSATHAATISIDQASQEVLIDYTNENLDHAEVTYDTLLVDLKKTMTLVNSIASDQCELRIMSTSDGFYKCLQVVSPLQKHTLMGLYKKA